MAKTISPLSEQLLQLGGAGGAEGDGEEKFLLPATASKRHGGCPVIKTLLRLIKSLGCQVE